MHTRPGVDKVIWNNYENHTCNREITKERPISLDLRGDWGRENGQGKNLFRNVNSTRNVWKEEGSDLHFNGRVGK